MKTITSAPGITLATTDRDIAAVTIPHSHRDGGESTD
jgi:hypothetical protein